MPAPSVAACRPRVLIAPAAWELACQEAERCYPCETAAYPLGALVPDDRCSPLEGLRWDGPGDLVLTHVLLPDPAVADFGPAHARFHQALAGAASDELQARAAALVARHARLAFLTKLHSHPHPWGAYLSSGDVAHNVLAPAARRWWEARGLDEALLVVLHETGAEAAARGWAASAFAAGWDGAVRSLGPVELLAEEDERLARALAPPYWATEPGRSWCDRTKAALRRAGYAVSRNLLGRGWRRYLLQRSGRATPQVLCLPPDLPAAAARLLEVIDARGDVFRLQARLGPCGSLEELGELILAALSGEGGGGDGGGDGGGGVGVGGGASP